MSVSRRLRGRASTFTIVTALATLGVAGAAQAGGLSVTDLNHGPTAADLASALVGSGVTVTNVTFTGASRAAGKFTSTDASIVGFSNGIVLDSGKVQTYSGDPVYGTDPTCSWGVEGPNRCKEIGGTAGHQNSTAFGTPGDSELTTLSGHPTFDAATLEFDFVPQTSNVVFSYTFGSEEYSDYSNTAFNDVFGFFVNGANCALVPGTTDPVSINTINDGNDVGGDPTPHHPELFRNNVPADGSASPINTELDGLTRVLTCTATVNPGVTNHIKLSVADASDPVYDSAVFIKSQSLTSAQSVSARGTVQGTNAAGGATPAVFSAINDCNPANSTRPFTVQFGGHTFRKTAATATTCSEDASLPSSGFSQFNTQTGTANGTLDGQPATIDWTFQDEAPGYAPPDMAAFTIHSGGQAVLTVPSQSPTAYNGSPGGVMAFLGH